jgi:hypothetical protein
MLTRSLAVLAALATVGLVSAQVNLNLSTGQTYSWNGSTAGQPTWARPNAGTPPTANTGTGAATPYTVLNFNVAASGSYSFLADTNIPGPTWDTYTFLYSGSFDPNNPLTNAITGNDDLGDTTRSGFTTTLTAGTNYFFVTTGFSNTSFGAFTGSISRLGVPSTWSSSLDGSEPTWARPSSLTALSLNNNTYYDTQLFSVDVTGNYTFNSSQTYDGYIFIYTLPFTPSPAGSTTSSNPSSLANLVALNDDGGTPGSGFTYSSTLTTTLTAGVQYLAVTSSYSNLGTGNYQNTIQGVGSVTLGPVPEPTSMLALGLGVAALIRRRRSSK